jgi:hypothetical protein
MPLLFYCDYCEADMYIHWDITECIDDNVICDRCEKYACDKCRHVYFSDDSISYSRCIDCYTKRCMFGK